MSHCKKQGFLQRLFLLATLLVSVEGFCQIRLDVLSLRPKEIYEIVDSDILVVDSLIMGDSSKIILSQSKRENFLHFKSIKIGKGCMIYGRGKNGTKGKDGAKGRNGNGPCTDGLIGSNGAAGGPGDQGYNLTIYLSKVNIDGSLIFDLEGGAGGNGGKGGNGGDGGAGTRVCNGGDAANGGNGGRGGNGGDGGNLKVFCKECTESFLKLENTYVFLRLFGGYGGLGGKKGLAGSPGLGSKKDGANARNGLEGIEGVSGKAGNFTFSREF